jgi:hypothetical protein
MSNEVFNYILVAKISKIIGLSHIFGQKMLLQPSCIGFIVPLQQKKVKV